MGESNCKQALNVKNLKGKNHGKERELTVISVCYNEFCRV